MRTRRHIEVVRPQARTEVAEAQSAERRAPPPAAPAQPRWRDHDVGAARSSSGGLGWLVTVIVVAGLAILIAPALPGLMRGAGELFVWACVALGLGAWALGGFK